MVPAGMAIVQQAPRLVLARAVAGTTGADRGDRRPPDDEARTARNGESGSRSQLGPALFVTLFRRRLNVAHRLDCDPGTDPEAIQRRRRRLLGKQHAEELLDMAREGMVEGAAPELFHSIHGAEGRAEGG